MVQPHQFDPGIPGHPLDPRDRRLHNLEGTVVARQPPSQPGGQQYVATPQGFRPASSAAINSPHFAPQGYHQPCSGVSFNLPHSAPQGYHPASAVGLNLPHLTPNALGQLPLAPSLSNTGIGTLFRTPGRIHHNDLEHRGQPAGASQSRPSNGLSFFHVAGPGDQQDPRRPVAGEEQRQLLSQTISDPPQATLHSSRRHQDSGHSYETAIFVDKDGDGGTASSASASTFNRRLTSPVFRHGRMNVVQGPRQPSVAGGSMVARSLSRTATPDVSAQRDGVLINSLPASQTDAAPLPTLQPPSSTLQGQKIARIARMKPDSITQSVREIFSQEQCNKILWLALHGAQANAIAWILHSNIRTPSGTRLQGHLQNLEQVVRHFVPELASGEGGHEAPVQLISRLLRVGDELHWSPYLLERAVEYAGVGKEASYEAARKTHKINAAERSTLAKWRQDHDGENPGLNPGYMDVKEQKAHRGLLREEDELERIQELGYRGNDHSVEQQLMTEWLCKIREIQALPDGLETKIEEDSDDDDED